MAKIGLEVTDSIYVVLNMAIMTRVGQAVLDVLGDSEGLGEGPALQVRHRRGEALYLPLPEDNYIISVNSGYGGNVLLGKKCFALRIASYLGKNEGWMAEHMLILGIENPQGEVKYVTAAFPSACGKTNLAMLIPPEGYRNKGYKVWTVGDDIAWMRQGADGKLYAINPENGFFGVAPGTNMKSNPNALISPEKGTIFTNVAHNLDDNTVWWEGLDKNPPENALDWTGEPWNGRPPRRRRPSQQPLHRSRQELPLASALSSTRAKACRFRHHLRRPPAPDHAPGVPVPRLEQRRVRRLPSWLLRPPPPPPALWAWSAVTPWPCCPSALPHGDYFQHWFEMGESWARTPPRSSTSTGSVWTAKATSCGPVSATTSACWSGSSSAARQGGRQGDRYRLCALPEDINLEGIQDFDIETLKSILEVDKAAWAKEAEGIEEFYKQFGDKLPQSSATSWRP